MIFVLFCILLHLVAPFPPKTQNSISIGNVAKRTRLENPMISSENAGLIISFAKLPFQKLFQAIRGTVFKPGESMMPRNSDFLSVLKYHDARTDDNFALRNWFDLEPSKEKLEQLKILLTNPTVHFFIEKMYVLEQASQLGDFKIIQKLVEKGIMSNPIAVVEASKYGHDHIVKFFLEFPGFNKNGLLELAMEDRNLKLVRKIMHGVVLEDAEKYDLLEKACDSGNLEIVKFLYEEKGFRFEQSFTDHFLISSVIGGGNLELLNYVMDHMQALDISDEEIRHELLVEAAGRGNSKILKFLLQDERFSLEARNTNDLISEAILWTNLDVFKFLKNERNVSLPENFDDKFIAQKFDTACFVGDLDFVEYLVNEYPGLKVRKNSAWLALKFAANDRDLQMMEYLFDNFNFQDRTLNDEEITGIYETKGHGWKSLQEYFKILNFLFDKFDIQGNTSLLNHAISNKNLNLARYLLNERNILPNQESVDLSINSIRLANPDFSLALFLIEKYGLLPKPETLNRLIFLKSLTEYDYLIRKGMIPQVSHLNIAIFIGDDAFINYLLDKNVTPVKSSLDAASFKGNLNLVKLFYKEYGIIPDQITVDLANVLLRAGVVRSTLHPHVLRYLTSIVDLPDDEDLETRAFALLKSDSYHELHTYAVAVVNGR